MTHFNLRLVSVDHLKPVYFETTFIFGNYGTEVGAIENTVIEIQWHKMDQLADFVLLASSVFDL